MTRAREGKMKLVIKEVGERERGAFKVDITPPKLSFSIQRTFANRRHIQPQPEAAISLIHKQPVRWTSSRIVSCDGGGGPLGHPRIFINVDKPQICWCTYCGLPFAHEHHRKHLQSLPSTTYPLEPVGEPAEVPQQQRVSDEAFGQR